MADKEKTFPTLIIDYQNDLELIETLLAIYSIGKRVSLRPFELTVLKYYIKYGFNKEAVDYIREDEKKTETDIRVANTHLRSKGYLDAGVNNMRKSSLSEDMTNLRRSFIEKKRNFYALVFRNV